MKLHLRVFNNKEEMNEDFQTYSANADTCSISEMKAIRGDTRTKWMICNDKNFIAQSISGLCFNRISCDVRTPHIEMMFMMSRLRSHDGPVDDMTVFYKRIRND